MLWNPMWTVVLWKPMWIVLFSPHCMDFMKAIKNRSDYPAVDPHLLFIIAALFGPGIQPALKNDHSGHFVHH